MAKQRNEHIPSSFVGCKRLQRAAGCFALGMVTIWHYPLLAQYGTTNIPGNNPNQATPLIVLPDEAAGATSTSNNAHNPYLLIAPTQGAGTATGNGTQPYILASPNQANNTNANTTASTQSLVPSPTHPVTQTVTPPIVTPPSQELLMQANRLKEEQAVVRARNMGERPPTSTSVSSQIAYQTLPNEVAANASINAVPTSPPPQGAVIGGNPSTFGTARDPVFQNMIKKMYPMSPEQIQSLREADLNTQRAIAGAAPVDTPTPTLSSQTVSLSPGSVPPVIRLSTGYVSSVVFVDETGAPWPVGAYSIGDPNSFNIQWDTKSNLLLIQGQKPYATGNMAVRLQDMPTPVMLTLVTDQKNVDYRIDFRVQGRGPQALASIIGSSLPQNADAILMNLLEGVPPQGSQPLHIVGGPAEGWLQGNTLYLRTSLTILSPAWIKTMTSADGTKVYQFNSTPMILASQGGQPLTLRIEGL